MFIYFRIVVPVIEASSSAVSVGVEISLQQSPKLVIHHPSSDSPDYWMFVIEPGSKMVFVPGKKRVLKLSPDLVQVGELYKVTVRGLIHGQYVEGRESSLSYFSVSKRDQFIFRGDLL